MAVGQDREVAQLAQGQLVNAFQRAPMSECLTQLGLRHKQLHPLIWQQIDGRIERARNQGNKKRLAGYRKAAMDVFDDDDAATDSTRQAALGLLGRLQKDPEAVDYLIGGLNKFPRGLASEAGKALQMLTGQNFGPPSNASAAEIFVAQSKWSEWWMKNKSNWSSP